MRKHVRVLAVAVASALALGLVILPAGLAADEKNPAAGPVLKAAEALKKGDDASAKKEIEALKKMDLEGVMHLFKLRDKGGLGVGDKPGAVKPDGIEAKIIQMAKKAAPADAKPPATDMGYIIAVIADVATGKCPVDKKTGEKDPKDWAQWSKDMKDGAMELAKAKSADEAKKAAAKVNTACNNCHGVFRE